MLKATVGFVVGVFVIALVGWWAAPSLMFNETVSPFGFEETIARIQHNIADDPDLQANGWVLSGLRNPARVVHANGGNVLRVMMIEACSTKYSKPVLREDAVRFLSILMPCKISVYKKNDGKVYIGTMNARLLGKLFGRVVGRVMRDVGEDQKRFLTFDPTKPAPEMILPAASPTGGSGGGASGGC